MIKYKDLSALLKFLVIYVWISLGFNVLYFLVGFIAALIK